MIEYNSGHSFDKTWIRWNGHVNPFDRRVSEIYNIKPKIYSNGIKKRQNQCDSINVMIRTFYFVLFFFSLFYDA